MNTGAEAVETAIKCAAPLGLSRQGHRRRTGRDPRRARQFSRPHQHHRRLLERAGLPRRTSGRSRRASAQFRFRRHRQRRTRAITPEHLRRADRADPGRGRRDRAAARAISPSCAIGAIAHRDPSDPRRGAVGPWPHRRVVRVRARRHPSRRPDPGQGAGRRRAAGLAPSSAGAEVMDVFTPGSHGSTFGGNPLAAAVGLEALHVIEDEGLVERSRELGAHLIDAAACSDRSRAQARARPRAVGGRRHRSAVASARDVCERLLAEACCRRKRTTRWSGSRRRSSSRAMISTGRSIASRTCCDEVDGVSRRAERGVGPGLKER